MKTFQVLDTKTRCKKIFTNGQFYDSLEAFGLETTPAETWDYFPILEKQKYTYLKLFKKNLQLTDYCDSSFLHDFVKEEAKIKNIIKSFLIASVNLAEECHTEYIPENTLTNYLTLKERAMNNVSKFLTQPPEYEILSKIHEFIVEVGNYDNSTMKKAIKYDIFGTRTGRLTTLPGSFPILTMPKLERKHLKPNNDLFVELDYNAAEIRTLLALSGIEQPSGDLHRWSVENVFDNHIARKEAKERTFSWLYNPNLEDEELSKIYDKKKLLLQYWNGESIKTPYGRNIQSDRYHALNYLLQSTTSDIVMENSYEILRALEPLKTNVAFSLHDSIILDCAEEDAHILKDMSEIFGNTRFGKFKVNMKMGKDFYNMKEVDYV